MFNIFKKKSLEIYWWSNIDGLEKSSPILKTSDVPLPDYLVNMPKWLDPTNVQEKGTIATCPAISEYFDMGYVVPLWCDVKFTFKENGEYGAICSDPRFSFSAHSNRQFKDFLPSHIRSSVKMVLKANSPWKVKTPDGYSMLQLPLYYHYDKLFETLPGIIWTDVYHEINQQMAIKQFGEFVLKKGHPMAMYIPYKRDNFSTIIEGPNKKNSKWGAIADTGLYSKFRFGYNSIKNKQKKQCPFHSIFN